MGLTSRASWRCLLVRLFVAFCHAPPMFRHLQQQILFGRTISLAREADAFGGIVPVSLCRSHEAGLPGYILASRQWRDSSWASRCSPCTALSCEHCDGAFLTLERRHGELKLEELLRSRAFSPRATPRVASLRPQKLSRNQCSSAARYSSKQRSTSQP